MRRAETPCRVLSAAAISDPSVFLLVSWSRRGILDRFSSKRSVKTCGEKELCLLLVLKVSNTSRIHDREEAITEKCAKEQKLEKECRSSHACRACTRLGGAAREIEVQSCLKLSVRLRLRRSSSPRTRRWHCRSDTGICYDMLRCCISLSFNL